MLGCAACAWGIFPEINALIHLEEFPNDPFRWKVRHNHHYLHCHSRVSRGSGAATALAAALTRPTPYRRQFLNQVMWLVGLSLAGTFIWDRLCVAIFAPQIFKASAARTHRRAPRRAALRQLAAAQR